MTLENEFLSATRSAFLSNRKLAEKAIEQIPDYKLRESLDQNTNSIAVIMKHVAGNLLSRWTDFLTTDGEKPWRDRDREFEDTFTDRTEIMNYWQLGWDCLLQAIDSFEPDDLMSTIFVRGEPHSLILGLQRSLGHTCYHVGQIVQIARVHAGDDWQVLTIPKGGSEQFNKEHWGQQGKSHS